VLLGASTSFKLQLVYSAAAAVDLEVSGSVVVVSNASPPVVDGTNTLPFTLASLTNTAGATADLVSGIASTKSRIIDCCIRNNSANDNSVTIRRTDGTNNVLNEKMNLLAGECAVYNGAIWLHKDTNGAIYPSVGNAATQAEMEAGTATTKYVTPQGVNWHPGAAKFWVIFTGNSTTITASWNMTSITDGTTQATVTIATDFSGTAWCCLATAISAAATAAGTRLASALTMAAGSIIVFCVDGAATTALADPTSWCVAGWGDQ
jgi:hypothetical protein